MKLFVYVLYSKKRHKSYVGCSHDVDARLAEHNAGKVRSTRGGAPWIVVYTEKSNDYSDARKRKSYYKSNAGCRKLKQIFGNLTTER